MIQRRLSKSNKNDPPNKARIFAKLVMEGQINSALRYLSEDDSRGVLPLTDDVVVYCLLFCLPKDVQIKSNQIKRSHRAHKEWAPSVR